MKVSLIRIGHVGEERSVTVGSQISNRIANLANKPRMHSSVSPPKFCFQE
ncbi:unnamed protein product [Brassica oleracea var. botrytis]